MKIQTAEIINEIEDLINRKLSHQEEVNVVDAIEFQGIEDPKELILIYDLD